MKKTTFSTSGGEKEHITYSEIGKDVINKEECGDVEISGKMVSCTKFIKAVKVKYDDNTIVICDSPGLEDTRGPELDVSNMYGIKKAA